MKWTKDRFTVLRELGRGGTSVVYLVADTKDRSLYAMKTLRREEPGSAPATCGGEAEELRAEAAVLEELGKEKEGEENAALGKRQEKRRPSIPQYKGEVVDGKGDFAGFLMEYVEGPNLQELLKEGKVYSVREAAQAGLQLCGILAYLHRQNPPLIYRDLKPANIVVRPDGTFVLVDYGAVRKYRKSAAADTRRIGTEGYAAPEQYGGWEQSDERTDVYGIGAVLHHMITGLTPLETGLRPLEEVLRPAERESAQGRKADSPAGRAQMAKILKRCCMTAPSMRYPSCAELEKALRDLLKTCGREGGGNRLRKQMIRDLLRKYSRPVCAAAVFVLCGVFAAFLRTETEKGEYRALLAKAQEESLAEKKEELYRTAAGMRPKDPEAYIRFARDLSGDFVITQKEKAALESVLYTEGDPERMRESGPGDYAKLQMELGKLYFAFYEGGREAAEVCFRNALESGRLFFGGRRTAEAMAVVLGDFRTADRIEAWKELEEEALREAEKTGDGAFAAAVCKAAAAEIALFADRYEQTGADEAAIREVIRNAERLMSLAQSGTLQVPQRFQIELRTAVESAARGEERAERRTADKSK